MSARAPTKSPMMGGRQRCRHGEPAHICPWCSYENGKEDGRKAERAKIVAWLRRGQAECPPYDANNDYVDPVAHEWAIADEIESGEHERKAT